jgi:hypothetical protein
MAEKVIYSCDHCRSEECVKRIHYVYAKTHNGVDGKTPDWNHIDLCARCLARIVVDFLEDIPMDQRGIRISNQLNTEIKQSIQEVKFESVPKK